MDLKTFLYKYGVDTTTNFDLKNIAQNLNIPLKVCMRDELPNEPINKAIIFNLQTHNQNGSHWVLIDFPNSIYFDGYGIKPTKEIYNYLQNETSIKYNTLQIQPDGTNMCGQLSIFVLFKINNEEKFEDIILDCFNQINEINLT